MRSVCRDARGGGEGGPAHAKATKAKKIDKPLRRREGVGGKREVGEVVTMCISAE